MRLNIDFTTTSYDVAHITERRWWCRDVKYTVALYGYVWIRDDTNDYVSENVTLELEAARYTALDIARLRL